MFNASVQGKEHKKYEFGNVSRSSIQLQKDHEGSWVPNKQNQRNTSGGENFAEMCFLRDDYLNSFTKECSPPPKKTPCRIKVNSG